MAACRSGPYPLQFVSLPSQNSFRHLAVTDVTGKKEKRGREPLGFTRPFEVVQKVGTNIGGEQLLNVHTAAR